MLRKPGQFVLVHKHALSPGRNLPSAPNYRKQSKTPCTFKNKRRQHSSLHRMHVRQAQGLFQQAHDRTCPGFASQHLTARGKIPTRRSIGLLPARTRQPQPPAALIQAYQHHTVRHIPGQSRLLGHQQKGAALLIENFNEVIRNCGQTDIRRRKHARSRSSGDGIFVSWPR